MTAKKLFASSLCAVVALAIAALISNAQDSGKSETSHATEHPFTAKVLLVHMADSEAGVAIESPELQKLGDRLFIVGRAVAPRASWKKYAGKKAWIPVSGVVQLWELDSVEDLKALYE
jgi:hypothetical protein